MSGSKRTKKLKQWQQQQQQQYIAYHCPNFDQALKGGFFDEE